VKYGKVIPTVRIACKMKNIHYNFAENAITSYIINLIFRTGQHSALVNFCGIFIIVDVVLLPYIYMEVDKFL
jgi:hypothetical protein